MIKCIGGYLDSTQTYGDKRDFAYKMISDDGGSDELVGTMTSGGYIRCPSGSGGADTYLYFDDITSFPYVWRLDDSDIFVTAAGLNNTMPISWSNPYVFQMDKTECIDSTNLWHKIGPQEDGYLRDYNTLTINSDGTVYMHLNSWSYSLHLYQSVTSWRVRERRIAIIFGAGSSTEEPIPGALTYCWKFSANGSSEQQMIWQGYPTLGTLYYSPNYIISPRGYIGFQEESPFATWETWQLTNTPASIDLFYWKSNDQEDASAIATGQPISSVITAVAWTRLQTKINALEQEHAVTPTTFTTVHSGDRITSALYEEIYDALDAIGYTPRSVPAVGTRITPEYFNGSDSIKGKCNEAIGEL